MNIVFILSQFVYILFFSSLITLARTYSMIIDRICERGQPCFVSDFRGESIQFYNIHACVWSHFSHVWLFVTLWMVALQTPLSMGFSRQAYWSGLLCPPLGDLPDRDQTLSPALAGGFFTTSTTWEAPTNIIILNNDLILHFLLFLPQFSEILFCSWKPPSQAEHINWNKSTTLPFRSLSSNVSLSLSVFLSSLTNFPHSPPTSWFLFILPSLQIQRRKAKKSIDEKGWTEGEASDLPVG